MDWSAIIAGGVAGLAAGVVGSLVAPWVQHAVENRRETRTHRRELIAAWRAMVAEYVGVEEADVTEAEAYVSLRSRLTEDALQMVEQSGNTIFVREGSRGIAADARLAKLADEIDRIEREWGLA